jgi:tripartite-type tricarboxylate transporter receptor subunit TctC
MGGHDAGHEPTRSGAVEAGKAKNLAVAARKRLKDAPDVPTFAEKGYEFYWEQMRGVVGPANMAPEAVKWWQDTLRKVTETKKWQETYIKRNLLTPTVDRRRGEQVPRQPERQYEGSRDRRARRSEVGA